MDDMDLDMNLEDSQDDPAGRSAVALKRGRLCANCVARAMKWASVISGQFDSSPASYTRFSELFDRFDRGVNAAVTTPVPLDGITGRGTPRLSLLK